MSGAEALRRFVTLIQQGFTLTFCRITRELQDITRDPPQGCSAGPKGENLMEWVSSIVGPEDTPYAGGLFNLDVIFPADYPFSPPKVIFLPYSYFVPQTFFFSGSVSNTYLPLQYQFKR